MIPLLPLELPIDTYHNVNVDGFWKGSVSGVGVIICNPRGSLICGQTKFLTCPTLKEVEAKTILTGMKLALEQNLEHIVIKGDSKLVVDAIKYRGTKKASLCRSIT